MVGPQLLALWPFVLTHVVVLGLLDKCNRVLGN